MHGDSPPPTPNTTFRFFGLAPGGRESQAAAKCQNTTSQGTCTVWSAWHIIRYSSISLFKHHSYVSYIEDLGATLSAVKLGRIACDTLLQMMWRFSESTKRPYGRELTWLGVTLSAVELGRIACDALLQMTWRFSESTQRPYDMELMWSLVKLCQCYPLTLCNGAWGRNFANIPCWHIECCTKSPHVHVTDTVLIMDTVANDLTWRIVRTHGVISTIVLEYRFPGLPSPRYYPSHPLIPWTRHH